MNTSDAAGNGRVCIFYPPLQGVSGGMAVLAQMAGAMTALGTEVRLAVWEEPSKKNQEVLAGLNVARIQDDPPGRNEIFILPEGWPNILSLGLGRARKCIVYCQNWSFLFEGLPANVRWRDLPVDFLAVSDPVARYLEQVLGKRPPVIRPAIAASLFHPPDAKPEGPARIGFMPRKNKSLAGRIQRIFAERNPHVHVEWIPIHGLDQEGVARALQSCHVFLVTGFPEGCPLPPLEAMACGCLCCGFTGFGGWDYMRQVEPGGYFPYGYRLRDVPWGGNGWWFADGDVLGAAKGLERAVKALESKSMMDTAVMLESYSVQSQTREVRSWLKTF